MRGPLPSREPPDHPANRGHQKRPNTKHLLCQTAAVGARCPMTLVALPARWCRLRASTQIQRVRERQHLRSRAGLAAQSRCRHTRSDSANNHAKTCRAKAHEANMHILFANAAFCSAFCEPACSRLIQSLSDSYRSTVSDDPRTHLNKEMDHEHGLSPTDSADHPLPCRRPQGALAGGKPTTAPTWRSRQPASRSATPGITPTRSRTQSCRRA